MRLVHDFWHWLYREEYEAVKAINGQAAADQAYYSFVVRPPAFCAVCGSAPLQRLLSPTRREVWCVQVGCTQNGTHVVIQDPVARGPEYTPPAPVDLDPISVVRVG